MSDINPFWVWATLACGGLLYQVAKLSLGFGTIGRATEDLFDAAYWSGVGILAYWWMTSP